ncbi:MAG: saccharopine dehydrogenase family protein [Halodesulfurarchaeum sp.]
MPSRVAVLGAGGVMGGDIVETLLDLVPGVSIVAADLDEARVRRTLEGWIDDLAGVEAVDVTDSHKTASLCADADVVVNAVGPCYELGEPVLQAAIEAGTDLVDLCDDYDATRELLDTYDEPARRAGVTAVLGMGASPGVSNVLARRAIDRLDVVDRVLIGVTRSIGAEAGAAIPYHLLHSWLGDVPVHHDGVRVDGQGLRTGAEVLEFPRPFGKVPVYHFGHPETITLPEVIDSPAVSVSCKGNFLPEAFRESLLSMEDLGLTAEHELTVDGHQLRPLDVAAAHLEYVGMQALSEAEPPPSGGAIVVEVAGEEAGTDTTYRASGTATMREATSWSAALGATFLLEGDIDRPGVWAPEAVVPPDRFVRTLLDETGFDLWEGQMTLTTREDG